MILDSRTGTKGNFLREDFESHASIQRIRRKEVFQRNSLASVFGLKKKKKKMPGLKLKILLAESEKEGMRFYRTNLSTVTHFPLTLKEL